MSRIRENAEMHALASKARAEIPFSPFFWELLEKIFYKQGLFFLSAR
jgi:hypothetical protein